jgi:hypothetical protein
VIGPARVIRRGTRVPLALVGFAALAIVGLVLVVAPPSRTVRVAVPSTLPRIAFMPAPRLRQVRPGLPRVWFPLRRAEVVAVAPGGRRPLWWVGLGALVVGGAGVVWSALALRS